jgi:hypothetical protein
MAQKSRSSLQSAENSGKWPEEQTSKGEIVQNPSKLLQTL